MRLLRFSISAGNENLGSPIIQSQQELKWQSYWFPLFECEIEHWILLAKVVVGFGAGPDGVAHGCSHV